MNKEIILKALQELRKEKKRKFAQTAELIINLRNFDVKKQSVNLVVEVPYTSKGKKVCAFLTKKSVLMDTITKAEFENYKNKKELKKLVKKYDSFIATASLMPSVAIVFGKVLGPAGKMPSPQLGIVQGEDEKSIKEVLEKINKAIKIRSKEPSLKIALGKENMEDGEIAENAVVVYNKILEALPRKKENLRSILIKFTMTKPIKLEIK